MASMMELRRRILANTPHVESVSGSGAVQFSTDMSVGLKDCKIYFTPIQEGSGTPSPVNQRPIHGWDEMDLTVCKKNLLDALTWKQGLRRYASNSVVHVNGIKLTPNTTYTISTSVPTGFTQAKYDDVFAYVTGGLRGRNPDSVHDGVALNKSRTLTTNTDGMLYIGIRENTSVNFDFGTGEGTHYIQVEKGSTATLYELYTGQTLTIPFPRTIYGGYLDLVRGEIVETLIDIDLTGITSVQTFSNGKKVWYKELSYFGVKILPSSNPNFIGYCDTYQILPYTATFQATDYSFSVRADANRTAIYVRTDGTSDITPTGNAVLEPATPNHIPLTDPLTIKTLRGVNNLITNANGNVNVSFWTH